jgi:hypothetical protein
MSLEKQFSNKLENLWKRRTSELRAIVIPKGVGQPAKFSRKVRDNLIGELLENASQILIKRDGRSEFSKVKSGRNLTKIKGHGILNRATKMLNWAESKLSGPIVYSFWKRRKCLYVGKSKSWRRLKSYDKSIYLIEADCIEVFRITTKGNLGKAECLATHLFEPRYNKVMAAKTKWGKACPICRQHDRMRDELNNLFKLK